MDDEEGRKIMYEREKILSKKIAYYFSKLLPKATVIANTTNVNSGVGLDRPVMYKNGVYIKL